ncbi:MULTISPECIES: DUF4214 domain-containing protein [unclassified Sulfitobacter]|uniref:DUF4214 domain-containing protein n=1 Tax=unclassified Sulfitobacter TaxID=196795 RepID=UPI003746C425
MATQEQKQALTALYVGYYDRAPDPDGLQFWIDQIDNGREFSTIAADFAAAPEALAKYPYLSTPDVSTPSTFITSIYLNLFGRTPDQAGLDFWTGVLNDGSVSVAEMIEEIIMGAVNDEDAGTFDKTVLDNKIEVGLDFAESTADVSGFEFDADAKMAAEAAVNGVTEDPATVEAAKAATDAYLAGETNQGDTLTLTAGLDTIDGTSGNDLFTALISEDGAGTDTSTLNIGDELDGGAGYDILRLRQTHEPDDVFITNAVNIEELQYITSDEDEIYLSGMTDIEKITVLDSSDTGNDFYQIRNLVDVEFRNNIDSVDGNFEFANDVVAGDVTMTFTNNLDNSVEVDQFETKAGDSLIKNLTVVNKGVNEDVDIDDLDIMETMTITGSGELDLDLESEESLTSIDASGMTGDVTISSDLELENDFTYTGSQGKDTIHVEDDDAGGHTFTINTGTGDDSVEVFEQDDNIVNVNLGEGDDVLSLLDAGLLAADTFEADDSYDGGDGNDSLKATNAAFAAAVAGAAANISNFEELAVTDLLATDIDLDVAFSGFNNITLEAGHGIVNAAAVDTTMLAGLDSGATVTIEDGAAEVGDILDLDIEGAATGTADELNLVLANDSNTNFGVIDTTDVETVNINADDSDDDADADLTVSITGTGTETVVVTGDAESLDLTGAALTDVEMVDGSAFEGDLKIDLTGNTNDVTVNFGAGDDEVTSGSGADTFTGGDGDDTYVYTAAAQSNGTNVDTITDFVSGEDMIDLSAIEVGAGTYSGEANGYGAVLTTLTGGGNSQAVLDTSTSTLYVDVNGDGALDNLDMAVDLTGVVTLDGTTDFVW